MLQEIDQYMEQYPEDIIKLFLKIRDVVFSIENISVEEKMWAKLPSYYYGERFVRIIPFKDHINIEAEGLARHTSDFAGCKFTPKGMLQIKTDQVVNFESLKMAFYDTYIALDKGKCISMNNTNQNNEKKTLQLTQEELDAKNSEAYYQATMDWQRGGKNPDEAYKDRGFKRNNRGHWVFM